MRANISRAAQCLFEEVGEGGVLGRCGLGDAGIQVRHRAQPQFLAQLGDTLMLQVAHGAPPAKAS
jgi:hypothetical protein